MTVPGSPPGRAAIAIGDEAVTRILEIARDQLGMDLAFVAETGEAGPAIRWVEGDWTSFPFATGGTALATFCARVLDGRLPPVVGDAAGEPGFAGIAAPEVGAAVAVPITVGSDETFGVIACVAHGADPMVRPTDAGTLRVLARAVARLLEQHGLSGAASPTHPDVDRIRRVLDGAGLSMVFQPIVDLRTGRRVGFEALARFDGEPHRTPDRWFAEAARADLGLDLEMAAVQTALAHLELIPPPGFLAVNASSATVVSPAFRDIVEQAAPGRLVVELTDHLRIEDRTLAQALSALGAAGVEIATDASDAGFETLSHLLQLAPDVIKIDGLLVRGIDTDPVRRALARTVVRFAEEIGATVVGESVQTDAELAMLRAVGVQRGQGNLLGEPGPLA